MARVSSWTPPPPSPQEDSGDYPPFLRATNLPKKGSVRVKIVAVREAEDNTYSDFFVDLMLGRKRYTLGMKTDSVNHRICADIFGRKTWAGGSLELVRGWSKKHKKEFVGVVNPKRKKK